MSALVLRLIIGIFVTAATLPSATAQAPGVTDDGFKTEVIEASKHIPVFVNFYAVWCRPCAPVFPVLETAAAEYAERVKLVSVNVDLSPGITNEIPALLDAQQIKRSPGPLPLPALVVFRHGQPVALLLGRQSIESDAQEFFARYAQ